MSFLRRCCYFLWLCFQNVNTIVFSSLLRFFRFFCTKCALQMYFFTVNIIKGAFVPRIMAIYILTQCMLCWLLHSNPLQHLCARAHPLNYAVIISKISWRAFTFIYIYGLYTHTHFKEVIYLSSFLNYTFNRLIVQSQR